MERRFIYKTVNNLDIVNIVDTKKSIEKSLDHIAHCVKNDKQIVFVGTKIYKKWHLDLIKTHAESCSMPYANRRWLGGAFSNYVVLRKSCETLEHMIYRVNNKLLPKIKKEQVVFERRYRQLNNRIGGLLKLEENPGALVVIDPKYDSSAVEDAYRQGIPVIALVDTNTSIKHIQYPIPGNDDNLSAVKYILNVITETIKANQDTKEETNLQNTELNEPRQKTEIRDAQDLETTN